MKKTIYETKLEAMGVESRRQEKKNATKKKKGTRKVVPRARLVRSGIFKIKGKKGGKGSRTRCRSAPRKSPFGTCRPTAIFALKGNLTEARKGGITNQPRNVTVIRDPKVNRKRRWNLKQKKNKNPKRIGQKLLSA